MAMLSWALPLLLWCFASCRPWRLQSLMHSCCLQAALQRGSWRFWPFRSSTSRKVGVPALRMQIWVDNLPEQ